MTGRYRLDLGEGLTVFFLQGDITQQDTDAIVNAANSTLMGGGGVDGAIHRAGGPDILAECKKVVAENGHLPTGEVVSTTGGRLQAAFVLHTVGPIWRGGFEGEPGLLANCFRNALRLADRLGLHNLAFPAISTGVYGYPSEAAALVAIESTVDALGEARNVREVRFVLFDHEMLDTFHQAARAIMRRRKANWHLESTTGSNE